MVCIIFFPKKVNCYIIILVNQTTRRKSVNTTNEARWNKWKYQKRKLINFIDIKSQEILNILHSKWVPKKWIHPWDIVSNKWFKFSTSELSNIKYQSICDPKSTRAHTHTYWERGGTTIPCQYLPGPS